MSQTDVEVSRRAYAAFNRVDREAFLELIHPDVEFVSLLLEAEGGAFRGLEGARRYFDDVHEVFGDWRTEIVSIRELGDGLVIESRSSGTGGGSGVFLQERFWQAGEVRDGKVSWWKFCRTEAEAVEAVELRQEQTEPSGG